MIMLPVQLIVELHVQVEITSAAGVQQFQNSRESITSYWQEGEDELETSVSTLTWEPGSIQEEHTTIQEAIRIGHRVCHGVGGPLKRL